MIKTKPKMCSQCGHEKQIWKNFEGNRYCKECWYQKKPLKPFQTSRVIPVVSDKRKPLDQLYSKLRKEFLNLPHNSTCRAKLPGCMNSTQQELTVHHTKGRGKYYLDTNTWIPLCLSCHNWVEEHPAEAKEMLLSEDRV
jgi:hypothetical protein